MSLEFRIAPPPQRCVSSTTISTSSFHNPSQRPQAPYINNYREASAQSAGGNYSHLERGSESCANPRDKTSWLNASAQQQRGFESAFRSAIERMRLSSESRLEIMGKESSPSQFQPSFSTSKTNKANNDSNSNIRQNVRVSSSQIPNTFNSQSDNIGWSQTYSGNGSNCRGPVYARSTSTSNFASGSSPWEMTDRQQDILRPSQNEKQTFNVNQTNGQASVQQRQTSSTFVRPASNKWNRSDDASKSSTADDPCGVYDNLDNYSLHNNQGNGSVINENRAATLGMHKPSNYGRLDSVSSSVGRSSSLNRDNHSNSVRIPIRHQSVSDMYSTLPATSSKKWLENDSSSYTSGGSTSLVTSNPVQRVISQTSQQVYASSASSQSNYDAQKYSQTIFDTQTQEKRSQSLESGSRERMHSSNKIEMTSMQQESETELKDLTLPSVKEIIRQVEAITKEVETSEVSGSSIKSSAVVVNNGFSSLTQLGPQTSGRIMSQSNPMSPSQGTAFPRITSSTTIQNSASSQTSPLTSIRKGAEARSSLNHLPSAATFSTLTSQRKSSDPTISRKSVQLPSDYQRLREAFVEQRNEIQRLRRELLGKDKEIASLQQNVLLYKQRFGNINSFN